MGLVLAKLSSRGQLTIPVEVRRKLGVRYGDRLVFVEHEGRFFIENSNMLSLRDKKEAAY